MMGKIFFIIVKELNMVGVWYKVFYECGYDEDVNVIILSWLGLSYFL